MRSRILALACFASALGCAQELGLPRAGCLRDAAGGLRLVFGLPGNFLVGEAFDRHFLSAACQGPLIAIKTETTIALNGRTWDAPRGPALLAFSPDGVVAWLPETSELLSLRRGRLHRLSFDPHGEILAISAPSSSVVIAVIQRDTTVWLAELRNGIIATESELPDIAPPLFLAGRTLIYADGSNLIVGSERLALPAPAVGLEHLGADCIRVVLSAGNGHLALCARDNAWQLDRLPEVEP
jgi:hypothetical protein